MAESAPTRLRPVDPHTHDLNVIIETPKGDRNKFKWDEMKGIFRLSGVLPAGAIFPFDFGFIPGTLGQDGDPVDVLVLMDEPAFTGCLIPARLVAVIEAKQTETDGKTERNDRLIAVATCSEQHHDVRDLSDLSDVLLSQIEHFFVSYNQFKGKVFEPIGRKNAKAARHILEEGIRRAA
jgi:inorganic pyrophosphatase